MIEEIKESKQAKIENPQDEDQDNSTSIMQNKEEVKNNNLLKQNNPQERKQEHSIIHQQREDNFFL